MTKAPHTKIIYINQEINKTVLFLAFELSNKKWKLGFSDGARNRVRNVNAGDMSTLLEVPVAKSSPSVVALAWNARLEGTAVTLLVSELQV